MSMCRIVIIEDDPADVLLVKEALRHHGIICELEQYSNGEDAAKAITAMLDGPALFLVDLNIPRMHGLELLRVIRACHTHDEVPTAILTVEAPSDKTESERLGADAYIIKSQGYQEFLTNVGGTIVQLLQRKLRGEHNRMARCGMPEAGVIYFSRGKHIQRAARNRSQYQRA